MSIDDAISESGSLLWTVILALTAAFTPGVVGYFAAEYAHLFCGWDLGWWVQFSPDHAYWDIGKLVTCAWWLLIGIALCWGGRGNALRGR